MTQFYFVRHGQTTVNLRHAFNGGGVDEPLTQSGVHTAQAMGQKLATTRFDQVISSDMPRAVKTAELIMQPNQWPLPVDTARGLHELYLGPWDGKIEAAVADTDALEAYFHRPADFDAQFADQLGIERYAHLLQRSRAVIAAAYAAHPTGKLLVVGHGILFQFLLNSLLGLPFARLREPKMLHNAALAQLDTENGRDFTRVQWDVLPEN